MENRREVDDSDFRRSIALCPKCTAIFKTNVHMQFRNVQGLEIVGMPDIFGEITCPVCSYPVESTKNSLYDFVEDTFKYLKSLGKPELFFLRDALVAYKESAKAKKDEDKLKSDIYKVAPKMFNLSSFLPTNSGEWAAWLSLLATITFGIITSLQSNDSSKTTVVLNNVGNTTVVQPVVVPDTSRGIVGRNDSCPCGSGQKFKKCHGMPRQK